MRIIASIMIYKKNFIDLIMLLPQEIKIISLIMNQTATDTNNINPNFVQEFEQFYLIIQIFEMVFV